MHAFSTRARKSDVLVSKDIVDELVHGGLFELATLARPRAELGWTVDLLSQEIGDV